MVDDFGIIVLLNYQQIMFTLSNTEISQSCSLTDSHRRMLGDLTTQSSVCKCNPPLGLLSDHPPGTSGKINHVW